MSRRTYLYKLTSDRGGAPCAPPPRGNREALLTLSICKPAIRRTALPGDRLLGITSQALVRREGYPAAAVIYAAVVTGAAQAREYFASRSPFRSRPDCIYEFHRANGTIAHTGQTRLHADKAYLARDLGRYPFYKNGRTLLSTDFRYFGSAAVSLERFPSVGQIADSLGQGHRVFDEHHPMAKELDYLFRHLWVMPSRYTPVSVQDESYGHTPRPKTPAALSIAAAVAPIP